MREPKRVPGRDAIQHLLVERADGRRVTSQPVDAVRDRARDLRDGSVAEVQVVCTGEDARKIIGGLPSGRRLTVHLDPVVREDRYLLGGGVHHEGQDPVPRPRALRGSTLVAIRQRRRVSMMPVGDQERFVGEPRGYVPCR